MQKKWKRPVVLFLKSRKLCVFIHEFAHCPARRGQLGEVFHPSGGNTSASAHSPCHIQATYTTPAAESLWHELHFASQGLWGGITVVFVKAQVEDRVFQAPSLVVAAHFGARRRKFAIQSWSWDTE